MLYVMVSSVMLHVLISMVNIYFFKKYLTEDIYGLFKDSIFTNAMFPVLISYFVLFGIIFIMFFKFKHNIEKMKEISLEAEQNKAAADASKQISAFIVQYIGENNYKILEWLKEKEKKGTPPKKVADAAGNISRVLNALTKVVFLDSPQLIPLTVKLENEITASRTMLNEK